ncbi:MAG: hypothetical protein A2832_02070 [Candidatus Zambryskibacteria bacterium RIFCSPHIGHO2_01_FULL_44_22b]|uniref:Uncharacterized protein n=2 Tax=Candidatus Zambryskiibacteriota TaxID=1817925 RepID=A0A1G2SZV1_9BACT|nr:MAG: hypothetical protein A2832_02070 [Candidatus Zambryskibacteria bacterium RIFCSPHIGHO2_01_FULL_44_22b]OHB05294.1 MAG: hypothetical protein A3B16_02745 [Candidatus Zambryskibacteria bacterium RIFCSPLOWO2_01_FULL_45_43]
MRIDEYLLKGLLIILASCFLYILMIFIHGMPLHDFNLWRLSILYRNVAEYHPDGSEFLVKKKYLGGPDEHGSGVCNYVVGEVRSAPRSKEEIQSAYSSHSIKSLSGFYRIPIEVLFMDEDNWPVESPWWEWEDEIKEQIKEATSTVYLVYIAIEGYPFLLDMRCDN